MNADVMDSKREAGKTIIETKRRRAADPLGALVRDIAREGVNKEGNSKKRKFFEEIETKGDGGSEDTSK